jgi:hypothetical protein
VLPMTVRIARGKGFHIEYFASVPSATSDPNNQTGANHFTSDFAGRIGLLRKRRRTRLITSTAPRVRDSTGW